MEHLDSYPDVPARRLNPKGVVTRRCASKDPGHRRSGLGGNECQRRTLGPEREVDGAVYQQGLWTLKGVNWEGTSANEDVGP